MASQKQTYRVWRTYTTQCAQYANIEAESSAEALKIAMADSERISDREDWKDGEDERSAYKFEVTQN